MAAHVTIGGTDYPVIFDTPGEQANLLQLNEITNPSGLKLYAVKEGDADPDRFITYANLVQTLLQANTKIGVGIACSGIEGQAISYAPGADLPSDIYLLIINDYQGKGITRVSYNKSGFVINSLESGLFDYLAFYIP